jgi:hypothetical protein
MTQLEKVTQQNAAMVEQASAAAGSLEEQSKALSGAVGAFRLNDTVHTPVAAKPAAPVAKKPLEKKKPVEVKTPHLAVVAKAKPKAAHKGNGHLEEGWQEF